MRTSLQSLGWRSLAAAPCELRLHATLDNGQCFGWRRQPGDDAVWVGVLGQRLVGLRETEGDCLFRCLSSSAPGGKNDEKLLRDELREYFQLDTDLRSLYDKWSRADPRMKAIAKTLPGMRVLRQEPVECLFSFICSSNNNIQRIGGMLHTLRKTYGEVLPAPGSTPGLGFEPVGHGDAAEFYTFPTAERLAAASEAELRALGLGYRAAYVRQTAAAIVEAGPEWLPGLRSSDEPDAVREALSTLSGVGPKVADCVALFSLDQASAIPVDTHVWDIACRDLDPELTSCGSLTPKVYQRVGELFRTRYGDHAGWAHSLLFAAELPLFTGRLPASMREEMAAFRAAGKAARMQEKVDRAEAKKEGRPYTAKQPYKKPVVTTPSKAKAKEEASTGKKKDKKRQRSE